MKRILCKSKIHRATVSGADLEYEGSISIDADLMDSADILGYEQVHVVNVNNGARFVTYAMPAPRGSGAVVVNGAGARLVQKGDIVIIFTYAEYAEEELADFQPTFVFVDDRNRVKESLRERRLA